MTVVRARIAAGLPNVRMLRDAVDGATRRGMLDSRVALIDEKGRLCRRGSGC